MGILPLKKRVNRDKCSFATKQRMFGVFAIDEILRYRGTRFPGSRTLCHPDQNNSFADNTLALGAQKNVKQLINAAYGKGDLISRGDLSDISQSKGLIYISK